MSTEERRFGAASALVVIGAALSIAAFAALASGDCAVFGLDDLFRCRASGPIAALLNAVAATSSAVLVWSLPARAWPISHRRLTTFGIAGAVLATVASIALPFVPSEPAFRLVAIGWAGIGVWIFQLSRHGPQEVRSMTGVIVGVTVVTWATFAVLSDLPVAAIGGFLLFLLFDIWALRAARRLLSGYTPRPEARGIRGWGVDVLVALGVAAMLPFWMVSTFGATLGDPGVSYTVRNETSKAILFYAQDSYATKFPGDKVDAGAEKTSNALASGTYRTIATDLAGARVFCRTLTQRELRLARFVIVVRDEPSTCR